MIEPVTKRVWVPTTPDEAFERFTAGIDTWWPKTSHSVARDDCREVRFETAGEGRRLVEESGDGEIHSWGDVSVWEPGARVVFGWHPGRDPSGAQEVEVTFRAAPGEGARAGEQGTLVELVHSGWEALGEGASKVRDEYVGGWDFVLGRFTERCAEVPAP